MITRALTFLAAAVACLAGPWPLAAQDSTPMPPPIPKATTVEPATTSTVMRTNSMAVLDDKKRLGPNDYVSFRVVEDRDNESQHLRINDSGELEVPYIGLVPASGRTCRELAHSVKSALEREYYYHATVIIAVDHVSEKSRGRIYVYGSVKGQGPQEIPADETYTVSKAVIRAGGFGDFANKRKVKVTRKSGQDVIVDLKRVIEEGHSEEDVVLQPDDQIFVPQKLINIGG
ncbi:MAG TPA: polysaccharide biosynthesis/export family protein [Chthoniobacterales bacterium]|jgi:protein involved in polysaccharide export with SLBB domain|nr:polysaccharide biosynthesis/export family protein [Chthoniobacterales bacterium]